MSETTTTTGETMTKRPETVHDERLVELLRISGTKSNTLDFYARRFRDAERRGEVPDRVRAEYEAARDAVTEALHAVHDHEVMYTYWARFWLVTSSENGHVHRTTGCFTCRPRTKFALLPELSGLGESDAVESQGSILCSVCFPTAPVEWTNGEAKSKSKDRDARAKAKAEREAKRLEKALLPSGEPLEFSTGDRWKERLSTLAAAKMWLTDAYAWGLNHPSYPPEAVALVVEAVAAKTGESVDEVRAAAAKRAAKR